MNRNEMEQALRTAGATVFTVNGEDSDEWVLRVGDVETPLRGVLIHSGFFVVSRRPRYDLIAARYGKQPFRVVNQ